MDGLERGATTRLTMPCDEHALDYLELEREASLHYTRFVYATPAEARAAHSYLYAKDACEFAPRFARVLVDRDGVVAAAALLEAPELARARFAAAIALGRLGLFESDAEVKRRAAFAAQALVRPGPRDLYVSRFAVAARARRRGIGAQLLSACEAIARRRGSRRLVLEVSPADEAAISLYRRAEFTQIETRRVVDPETARELVYSHLAKRVAA
jgi:ribosomal protein S18 acetylase RimI-like enzyme